MYKIIIKGDAETDYPNLEELDGISAHDCFCDYIDDDFGAVSGGYLRFKEENGILYSITEYDSTRELKPNELMSLQEYTQGQWSDGIGEGFEQQACHWDENGNDVFISPWHGKQIISTEQFKNEDLAH